MSAGTRYGVARSVHVFVPALVLFVGLSGHAVAQSCRHGAMFSFKPERTEVKEIQSVHYTDANGRNGTIEANANQIVFTVPSKSIEELKQFATDHAGCKATAYLNDVELEVESVVGLFGTASYIDTSRFFNAIVPSSRMDIGKLRSLVKPDNIVSVIVD